jgi:transcriptional regulator with XRE-family HTH domain
MTQDQLAFAAEIDFTYVDGIERTRNPSVLALIRIAMALGTEPSELLKAVSNRQIAKISDPVLMC